MVIKLRTQKHLMNKTQIWTFHITVLVFRMTDNLEVYIYTDDDGLIYGRSRVHYLVAKMAVDDSQDGRSNVVEHSMVRRYRRHIECSTFEELASGCPVAVSAFLLTHATGAIRRVLFGDVSGKLEIQLVRDIRWTSQ